MNKETIQQEQWLQNPNCWKLGIFYFNKEDKRIFPPKRIKQMGWTINFAHWQAWFILFIIFLVPILIKLF
jgi:uncharacterized membrane protein